ncbi:YdbL family probable chaperone protein [Metallibacterium scheffleri]
MHKPLILLAACLALLAGCVTINVYFPAAAAQKAAQQIVGNVLGTATSPAPAGSSPAPASSTSINAGSGGGGLGVAVLDFIIPPAAAAEPDMNISTPGIQAIEARMKANFEQNLEPLLKAGVIGFTANGNVAVRDLNAASLPQRAGVSQAVASANRERADLYAAIASANGHPEWEPRIRAIFAQTWIQKARPGWYYRDSSGAWRRK